MILIELIGSNGRPSSWFEVDSMEQAIDFCRRWIKKNIEYSNWDNYTRQIPAFGYYNCAPQVRDTESNGVMTLEMLGLR